MAKQSRTPTLPQAATPAIPLVSDSTFRRFIEHLPVMFYAVGATPPHTPLYISPTFAQFGYPLSDWMTKSDIWTG